VLGSEIFKGLPASCYKKLKLKDRLTGAGGAPLILTAEVAIQIKIAGAPLSMVCLVCERIPNVIMIGLNTQEKYGIIVDTAFKCIRIGGNSVSYRHTVKDIETEHLFVIIQKSNVDLADTVVLLPDRDYALVGEVQDQALKNESYLEIDPVQLRLRYSLSLPRTIINKNTKTCVVVCRNPYSRPIKLLKGASIGIASPVNVSEDNSIHLMLPESKSSCPDNHPEGLVELQQLEGGMKPKVL
jgi:hypothetical protein